MKNDDIFDGDIAIIRQQATIENGEIAAVVILTSEEKEPVGVIKKFYSYIKSADTLHWLLKSSNPIDKHIVVIPENVNKQTIKDLYQTLIQKNRVKFYENAQISIAGKYFTKRTSYWPLFRQ